jgi:hypothetical protein
VRQIVLAVIGRPARPAHVVELQSPLPPPSELGTGLELTAPTASPKRIALSMIEQMFAFAFGQKLA